LSDLAAPLTNGADLTPDQKVLLVLNERKNGSCRWWATA